MRLSSIITVLLAIILAGAAGYLAQQWLEQQRRLAASGTIKTGPEATVVVAARPLRFGSELSVVNLREIEWPKGDLPPGAFTKVSDLIKEGERRLALAPIEPNELVLAAKITGPGQRATLSSLIGPGMKAITIRVNDVNGVAGFVLPGDRIDVMLTRKAGSDGQQTQLGTEVLLQNVRVLGIDQLADERADKARVVRAVTVEVSIEDAQRIVLASSVGSLSLALRAAGAGDREATGRVTPADLSGERRPITAVRPVQTPAEASPSPPSPINQESTQPRDRVPFGVVREVKRFEYSVPSGDDGRNSQSRSKPQGNGAQEPKPREPSPRPNSLGKQNVLPKARLPGGRAAGETPQSWLNLWSVRTSPSPTLQP
jgi:pilus assembly protein CpaB